MKTKTTLFFAFLVLAFALLVVSPAQALPASQEAAPTGLTITPLIEYTFGVLVFSLSAWLFSKAREAWLDYRPNPIFVSGILDDIVTKAVEAAEQKYMKAEGDNGRSKMAYALASVAAMCKQRGIVFDVEAIEPLIESAVYNLGDQLEEVFDE